VLLRRAPIPALGPFIEELWAGEGEQGPGAVVRQRMLPSGRVHLVLRLADGPLRIFEPSAGGCAQTLRRSLVGGARSGFYVREHTGASPSVGAVLHPGAAPLLFGVGADELAERHTELEDLWGSAAVRLRARVAEAPDAAARLRLLEAFLAGRLPVHGGVDARFTQLLRCAHELPTLRAAAQASALSQRQFIAHFRRGVGLGPKRYLRVRRFQRVLRQLHGGGGGSWAELALQAGYSDQAHFNREFLAFAGITPGAYRRLAPPQASHLQEVNFLQDTQGRDSETRAHRSTRAQR